MTPLNAEGKVDLLGTIVYWDSFPKAEDVGHVQSALKELGLPVECARSKRDRDAFIRAVRKAEKEKLVRRLAEKPDAIIFQFTEEYLAAKRLDYQYAAQVRFDKQSGNITSDSTQVLVKVQDLFLYSAANYEKRDLTAIVQRLFKRVADLLPLRAKGAVYFVPATYVAEVERIGQFMARFDNRLQTIAVPKGDAPSKHTVLEAFIADADAEVKVLSEEIDALVVALAADGKESEVSTKMKNGRFRKAAKIIARVEVYEQTLGERLECVRSGVKLAKAKLETALVG
jgi:hypothetical protein